MDKDGHVKKITKLAEKINHHPELGYKEFQTKETIRNYLSAISPDQHVCEFSTTGLKTTLGKLSGLHVALIAELDAVYCPTHFLADEKTGAAHNCGHYSQVAIMLSLFEQLYTRKAYESLDFTLSFIFVPAEEYLDLSYREQLKRDGVIKYYGGKQEAMRLGVFDDIDFSICVHAMGGVHEKRSIEINCDLAGFLYKKYHFNGQASHAGFDPFSGVNAYSMSTLFNTAVGLLRQQLDETYKVRINPIVLNTNMSQNVIPNQITVGTDLRTHDVDYMHLVAKRLDTAAQGTAHALTGTVNVDTEMGYLPFIQYRYLSAFVETAFKKRDDIDILVKDQKISASGDIGDLSYMMPCIQIGYSGFNGTIHGDDFKEIDPDFIYGVFPSFLQSVLTEMSGRIDPQKLYKRDALAYQLLMDQF